jgi:hypothetical protein
VYELKIIETSGIVSNKASPDVSIINFLAEEDINNIVY